MEQEAWREPITSDVNGISDNLNLLVLHMATLIPEATQVDVADNMDASDRLNREMIKAQRNFDTIFNDLRKKRYAMKQRCVRSGSVDQEGEGKDFTINR